MGRADVGDCAVPFDAAKAWPERRGMRVRGEIEGFGFRLRCFPDPRGAGQFLLVTRRCRRGEARVGAQVRIRLEPDLEEREAVTPPETGAGAEGRPEADEVV